MLTAQLENGQRVIAWETEKQQSPFLCPVCGGFLNLRKGKKRVHHFAHAVDSYCPYRSGETQEHLHAKKEIYESLKLNPRVSRLELERHLTTVRPDISMYIDKTRVAIEVQRSNLSLAIVKQRIAEYTRKRIALMWVLTSPPSAQPTGQGEWERADCIRLRDWQRYLKGLYYNRLYYFAGADQISVFAFEAWRVERGFGWEDQGEGYWDHEYYDIVQLKNTWKAVHLGKFNIVEHAEAHFRKPWKDFQAAYLWRFT